jgi:ferritin-like metal-binding protein YciE
MPPCHFSFSPSAVEPVFIVRQRQPCAPHIHQTGAVGGAGRIAGKHLAIVSIAPALRRSIELEQHLIGPDVAMHNASGRGRFPVRRLALNNPPVAIGRIVIACGGNIGQLAAVEGARHELAAPVFVFARLVSLSVPVLRVVAYLHLFTPDRSGLLFQAPPFNHQSVAVKSVPFGAARPHIVIAVCPNRMAGTPSDFTRWSATRGAQPLLCSRRQSKRRNRKEPVMGLFSADIKNMDDLFVHTLQDIYYAENQILKSLPEMIEKVSDKDLSMGLKKHLEETQNHVARLEQVFKLHGSEPKGVDCPAIDGIIEEADDIVGEVDDKEVLDAAIIAAAQAVEHYEITRYGTLIAWAHQLGRDDCATILQKTLDEEKAADKKLTAVAESKVNRKAAS